jgi:hypothetical protein
MRSSLVSSCGALALIASAAMLAGCGGGGAAPVPLLSGSLDRAHAQRGAARGGSWMAPQAKKEDLLYVSDLEAQAVFIYRYGHGNALVGTITGFFNPEGLCVDKKGDVFVTNDTSDGDHQILEYAHGSTTPLATLNDPYGRVNGCSVDPTTGNLAVTNFWGASEGTGGVSIYPHAKGTPASYSDSSIYYYYYCGYDDAGNLFVDGLSSGSSFGLAELPSGSGSFTDISLDQTIYLPGGVQWDGKYLAVGDQVAVKHDFTSVIYQFSISGSAGTEIGTTLLDGSNQVAQFWLPKVDAGKKKGQAATVIGPDGDGKNTLIWAYPAGGSPTATISGEQDPTGATLSLAKR